MPWAVHFDCANPEAAGRVAPCPAETLVSVAAIFDGGGGKLFDGLPASASRTL
jgi:hypothetical protein